MLAEGSAGVLLVLLLAKALAYAVSLGCGFRGGPVFPAIFLGVAVATFPVVWFDVSPTWAVAAGAAAGMAAMIRLLLSSMVLAALLIGVASPDTLPATVLAAVAAWLTMKVLERRREAADAEGEAEDPAAAGQLAPAAD